MLPCNPTVSQSGDILFWGSAKQFQWPAKYTVWCWSLAWIQTVENHLRAGVPTPGEWPSQKVSGSSLTLQWPCRSQCQQDPYYLWARAGSNKLASRMLQIHVSGSYGTQLQSCQTGYLVHWGWHQKWNLLICLSYWAYFDQDWDWLFKYVEQFV